MSAATTDSAGAAGLPALDALLALRELHAAELLGLLGVAPGEADENRAYQGLAGVTHAYRPGVHAAHFYLRAEEPAMIYVSDVAYLSPLNLDDLRAALGSDGVELRSRQAKRALMHVWAERGVAASVLDGKVGFLEVFPPLGHEQYLETIYEEPPAFVR